LIRGRRKLTGRFTTIRSSAADADTMLVALAFARPAASARDR